jgi:alkylation response protein AidB-like acyl-CoA dehydrogenase
VRFILDDEQRALHDAVATLLSRHAGADRMRGLGGDQPTYDDDLERELHDSGFAHCFSDPDTGPLEAALVVEAVAESLGVVSAGATCLIAPALLPVTPRGPIAILAAGRSGPARYLADAGTVLVIGADEVSRIDDHHGGERVSSAYGYPMGRLGTGTETVLDGVLPDRALAWWRVSIALELVGTMRAALQHSLTYTTERQQFGRSISSFQAVQHRLAECTVLAEGSRWLALEAASNAAPTEAAAVAITYATTAARRIMQETHQFAGAMGFTKEFDLHLWTMRIPALVREAESVSSPARAVAESRWALRGG